MVLSKQFGICYYFDSEVRLEGGRDSEAEKT